MKYLILEKIEEKGLTISDFVEQMGWKQRSSFYNIINGNPTIPVLERMAKILDCQVSDLLCEEDEPAYKDYPHCYTEANEQRSIKLRLRQLLSERGLTSAKFAELVGLHKTSISYILNGKHMPSVDTLFKFSKVLNCKFTDLFIEDEMEYKPITPDFKCPHCGGALDIQVQKKELD